MINTLLIYTDSSIWTETIICKAPNDNIDCCLGDIYLLSNLRFLLLATTLDLDLSVNIKFSWVVAHRNRIFVPLWLGRTLKIKKTRPSTVPLWYVQQ